MARPTHLTPLPPPPVGTEDNDPYATGEYPLTVPQDSLEQRIKKWGGVVALIFGLVGTVWGAQSWFVGTIEVKTAEAERRVDHRVAVELAAHKSTKHPSSVSKEVYDAHVAQAKEANDEAKQERREIRKVLDLIGQQTYRSPSQWDKTLKKEGVPPVETKD